MERSVSVEVQDRKRAWYPDARSRLRAHVLGCTGRRTRTIDARKRPVKKKNKKITMSQALKNENVTTFLVSFQARRFTLFVVKLHSIRHALQAFLKASKMMGPQCAALATL